MIMAKRKKARRRAPRRKSSGRRRKPGLGILGKMGIAIGFGAPMSISALSGIERAIAAKGFTFTSRIMFAFYTFLNTLVVGFGGDRPFDRVKLALKTGGVKDQEMRDSVASGSFIPIVTVGAVMTIIDVAMTKVLGKNVKLPGTNYNLI